MPRQIVVPDGMYAAALKFQDSGIQCSAALRAALEWLSENPIVPTEKQALEMITGSAKFDSFDNWELARWGATEWQRRMFLALEPEVPEEVTRLCHESFKGLSEMTIGQALAEWPARIAAVAARAYQLGKEDK